MTTLNTLTIVAALLAAGVSLAMAQAGPPTSGGYPPVARGASGMPTVPGPNVRVPTPSHPTTRHQRRLHMQAQHVIPGCSMGLPANATCACGTGASGGPLLCQPGQWCHYPFAKACTQ
jgi:hypothetical protein